MSLFKSNVLILGGGIMGLTLARTLIGSGFNNIVILEKERTLGCHASGRNSGVLHSGVYYDPDTYKATFCLESNRKLKGFCNDHSIPVLETGKVIVAKTDADVDALHILYNRALSNGAQVSLISPQELSQFEPCAKTKELALWVKDTAVVDPKQVLFALESELKASGQVQIWTECAYLKRLSDDQVMTTRGPIQFNHLINVAGGYSDRIAHDFGVGLKYRLLPFKGLYRKINPPYADGIKGNIYPVPDLRNPFLGIHFTRNAYGDVMIGPTAVPAFSPENYGFLSGLDRRSLSVLWSDFVLLFQNSGFRHVAFTEPKYYLDTFFYKAASQLVTGFKKSDMSSSTQVGIRPQLVDWETKKLVMDFMVTAEKQHIHVLNAISPAFTCAMSFSEYIVNAYLS